MKTLLFLAALVAAAFATDFQDCGSEASNLSFSVEGCDSPPCVVHRGETYLISIGFTTDKTTQTLTADVKGNIGGVEVPWPGFNPDGCSTLAEGQSCPIEAGKHVTWEYPCEILIFYPPISALVTFKLFDDDKRLLACVQAPVSIV